MLLLCLQLFFVLPYYQPAKDPISFECVLGESVSKLIELNLANNAFTKMPDCLSCLAPKLVKLNMSMNYVFLAFWWQAQNQCSRD